MTYRCECSSKALAFFLLDANKKRNKNLHVFLKMCNFAAETNTNT